jgi:citrate lyase subunit beta/citryl-CoA lyase
MLFTPGNNMRMIAKSGDRHADAVILDLEDSVPMPDKETGRLFVRDALADVSASGSQVYVRINALATGLAEDDLDWVVRPGLSGIMQPKAERGADVAALDSKLAALETGRSIAPGTVRIVPLIETALGVANALEIAGSSDRVVAVAFGGVDFSRDMGVTLTREGTELAYARARIAIAARASGVLAIDTPCLEVRDGERLAADTHAARQLGFRGKLLIHPSQVDAVNELLSPSEKDVAYSRKVVDAFEEAQAKVLGAISLDGKMIDVANFGQAQDVLAAAASISKRTHDDRTS